MKQKRCRPKFFLLVITGGLVILTSAGTIDLGEWGKQKVFAAQQLTVRDVLFRASQSLLEFEKVFSNVVAEERYGQKIINQSGKLRRTRKLVSDFLLVRPPGADNWFGFRDVFEVDGKLIRDRQERLRRLFLDSPEDALEHASKILKESARYNIGGIQRNINLPTMALAILHPLNQYRFFFEKTGEETIDDVAVWIIRFSEHSRPTLIRAGRRGRGDVYTQGSVWIAPENGQLIYSELMVGDTNSNVRSQITVKYRFEERFGVWVPSEMHEIYDRPKQRRAPRIEGEATYSNFRKFEVEVDETIKVPQ
jgi:hypothetical protein